MATLLSTRCLVSSSTTLRSTPLSGQHTPGRMWRSLQTTAQTTECLCTVEGLSGTNQGISVLTMNRPKAKNAISVQFLTQFRQCLEELRFNSDARVVVVRSLVDGVFCAGADLKERATMTSAEIKRFLVTLRQGFSDLQALPMPTIASIDGAALGGGLEMALCCDLRVGGSKARVGLTETRLAIIPGAGGTQRLVRLVGLAKAKELIYTARICSPAEAEKIGLLNYAVADTSSMDKALELSREIAARGPIAIRQAKVALDCGSQVELDSALTIEQLCYAPVLNTQDRLEGLQAFREKRSPQYKESESIKCRTAQGVVVMVAGVVCACFYAASQPEGGETLLS